MTLRDRLRTRLLDVTDRFVPPDAGDSMRIHRIRMALFQVWTGIGFTTVFCALYAIAGSPISALAIGVIALTLMAMPFAIRRGGSIASMGNLGIGVTWLTTFIVAARTGGFGSPALVWTVLFPLFTYAACGPRSASIWTALSCLQIAAFWGAERAKVVFVQDLSAEVIAALRVFGYAGVVVATRIAPSLVETARRGTFAAMNAESRARDRARILDDMHDGIGSQLLGVLIQLRAGPVATDRVAASLESCLDDLRLIVASLDPLDLELEVALGDLRARLADRFQAAGVELDWRIEDANGFDAVDGAAVLQVLRALQEMLTNALRHARTSRVTVTVSRVTGMLVVSVRDYGIGFDGRGRTAGRGLKSLRARARKLGGDLTIEVRDPGTEFCIRFPVGAALARKHKDAAPTSAASSS